MSTTWGDSAARFLTNELMCPRCETPSVSDGRCARCRAVLTGETADRIRTASLAAAERLRERDALIADLETAPAAPPPPVGAPTDTTPPAAAMPAAGAVTPPVSAADESRVSVQSVLAVAGAALVAIAALVFAYLTPDLDTATRNVVIGVVTALFLGGAWWLAGRGIRFSAEAVGALAAVFLALDVAAVAERFPADRVTAAAVGTLAASLLLLGGALLVRLRSWLWLAVVGVVVTPVLLGIGAEQTWGAVVGWLGATAVAVAVPVGLARLETRMGGPLRAETVTSTILTLAGVGGTAITLAAVVESDGTTRAIGTSAAVAALAVLAGIAARWRLSALWSALAGLGAVVALGILPFALDLPAADGGWYLALAPAATGIAVAASALLPVPGWVRRGALTVGAYATALAAALPTVMVGLALAGSPAFRLIAVRGPFADTPAPWDLPVDGVPDPEGLAAVLGVLALAGGMALLGAVRRSATPHPLTTTGPVTALWLIGLGLTALTAWSGLPWAAQLIAALGGAATIALVLALVPKARHARALLRAPALVAAHGMLLIGVLVAWSLDALTVLGGLGAVVVVLALAAALRPARAAYVAAADALLLVVLARALVLAELDDIVVLSLTATAGVLIAFVVTLVPRIPAAWWYGVLVVTTLPVALGVAALVPGANRSGWQALSTGAIVLLAIVLLITRRPGLTRAVRALAAAVVVPGLAVVAVSLASQFLDDSGSPYALPVIAVLVAVAVGAGHLVAESVGRRDGRPGTATAVRVLLEVSSALTAVIAVLLALLLPAAGYPTAMIVLLLLGIGAAAARVFGGRRYGWWLAGAAWTGALWCVWALAEVRVLEPYLLPPALAAVLVGLVLAWRERPGAALVAVGLTAAVAPSLVVLAVAGNGDGALLPWRALGLLAGSLLLLSAGVAALRRRTGSAPRLASLRAPVLAVALLAATAGAVQAVRVGLGVDAVDVPTAEWRILPALAWSAVGALLAALAGAVLVIGARRDDDGQRVAESRWLLAPALVGLVVGPICAVGPGTVPTWTLWGLALAVFALTVLIAARGLAGRTLLPPVWFAFLVGWATGVAGWSVRDLHVEVFSLPMGAALLAVGVLALRSSSTVPRSLDSWPAGFRGSWWLLTPGIVVTLLPSMIGTATNPATWRAILVLALAVAGVLLASLFRLAAPFLLGLIVLVIENAIVLIALAGQGREISAAQIWIAVGALGAVLLAIAVNSERRTAKDGSSGVRMRDLR